MSRPIVIETRIFPPQLDTPKYRWTCARCCVDGAWLTTLDEAEAGGLRHNRAKHSEGAVPSA
jgi:hypothetical protein